MTLSEFREIILGDREDSDAMEKLLTLAKSGNIDAIKLAYELLDIKRISEKYAADIFKMILGKAIRTIDADLYFKVGEAYFNGLGVDKNFAEAEFWFKKLFDLPDADIFAQLEIDIAKIYLSQADYDEINFLKRSMRRARLSAGIEIKFIADDYLRKGNFEQAIAWLRYLFEDDSAENFYQSDAANLIADIYFERGDIPQTIHWLKNALELGGKDSMIAKKLSDIYFSLKDDAKGLEWLIKAAEFGNTFAQKKLAEFYLKGKIVPRDELAAIYWYEKILDTADIRTQTEMMRKIAYIYKTGENVRDENKSVELYAKAQELANNLNYTVNRMF